MEHKELFGIAKELDEITFRRKLALDAANLGYWDWNMENDSLWWSESMFGIYGLSEKDFTNHVSFWYDQLDKEEYEASAKVLENAVNEDKTFINAFSIRDRDYNKKKIFAIANMIKGKDGKPKRMVGINVLLPDYVDVFIGEDS